MIYSINSDDVFSLFPFGTLILANGIYQEGR
jgi:hypothetical protein